MQSSIQLIPSWGRVTRFALDLMALVTALAALASSAALVTGACGVEGYVELHVVLLAACVGLVSALSCVICVHLSMDLACRRERDCSRPQEELL